MGKCLQVIIMVDAKKKKKNSHGLHKLGYMLNLHLSVKCHVFLLS